MVWHVTIRVKVTHSLHKLNTFDGQPQELLLCGSFIALLVLAMHTFASQTTFHLIRYIQLNVLMSLTG